MCKAMLDRYYPLNLSKLDLSINHNISDLCVKFLFKCIGEKCHKLQCIDLSYANITDLSCDIIYNFYYKYFINHKNKLNHKKCGYHKGSHKYYQRDLTHLHKIDLSFTRISENGLITLDQLFNELPSNHTRDHENKIKYIHNKSLSSSSNSSAKNITNTNNKQSSFNSINSNNDNENDKDPLYKIMQSKHRKKKSQSFEIVLKGCFFEPMLCKNYNCLASIPKLQTHCCIKLSICNLISFGIGSVLDEI